MKVSRKLIEGHDGDGPALFVVEGNPEQGYDLFQAHLVHVSHHQRSWQAVDAALREGP